MQSWMDAGAQIRQGHLLPRWAFSPAFNAGEPRFVFYPPLSWWTGALLLLGLPASVVPAAYTSLALTLAAGGMFALALLFTGPWRALLATALYLANPYLLFTAWERTAYAELLAAAWLPWLLCELLRERPRVLGIALPVALLWLTNAPAAVMGVYALGLIVATQSVLACMHARRLTAAWPLCRTAGGGLLLGLGLAGFYLVPAAWERRYVQIAMAIIPNMRIEDNFLFGHTGYGPHDAVLHTASMVAVALLLLGLVALLAAWALSPKPATGRMHEAVIVLTVVGAAVLVLVWRPALPVWHLLPEMPFLQFPWRLLAVLGCVFGAAVAMALRSVRVPAGTAAVVALALAAAGGPAASTLFREGCEAHELPAERVVLFDAHHGVGPTDEYTPGDSDNDQLRWNDPAWWLADTVNAPGPGTVANPAATMENYDAPPPLAETISGRAPMHLRTTLAVPRLLVLNLRDYPAWVVEVNGIPSPHLGRDDGLLAVALPPGVDTVEVHWQRLPDVWLGDAFSLCALGITVGLAVRSRQNRLA